MSELRRELGIADLTLFNIAAVIGIRWLAAAAHTGPGSLALWIAAAALFFVPCSLAVASLAMRFPEQGGIYIWTQRALGDWHGFLCGYCYWLSNLFYFPNLILSGVSMAFLGLGLPEDRTVILIASLAVLWAVLLANIRGLAFGKWIGNIGGIATWVVGLILIGAAATVWIRWGSVTPIRAVPELDFDKLNFWSQIAFAFGGIELGAIMAGEIRDPRRTIPRAAWISGAAIAAFYILGTMAILAVLAPDQVDVMTGLVQAAQSAGSRLGLSNLGLAAAGLMCLSVAGQLGAWIAGSARLPYVIGIDRYLPESFARTHPRWWTPHVSILVQGVASTVFVVLTQAGENLRTGYQLLVDMTVILYFVPFGYLFLSAWIFRAGGRMAPVCGMFVTLAALALSLAPPAGISSIWLFEAKLIGGSIGLVLAARLWFQRVRAKHF